MGLEDDHCRGKKRVQVSLAGAGRQFLMTGFCRELPTGQSRSLSSSFDLVLGILTVGILLLAIPFLNWLTQEDLKSEQRLLRRTLSR